MTAFRDGPATFSAQDPAPWAAWTKTLERAVVEDRLPAQWPGLTRGLRSNETDSFAAALRGCLDKAAVLGSNRAKVWAPALAALAPQLRADKGAAKSLHFQLWNHDSTWVTKHDGGANVAQLLTVAWDEPWAPQSRPTASDMEVWGKARHQALWAYHLVQAWLTSSQSRGWGQPVDQVDEVAPSPFLPLVRRLDASLSEAADQSHWRVWARQLALVQMAGLPGDLSLRQLADDWQLGWPQVWGGPGLQASWDRPVNANLAAVENIHALKKEAIWRSPVESLFAFAMDYHFRARSDVMAPSQVPAWLTGLRELIEARRGQQAANYQDPDGTQGWAKWNEVLQTKGQTIPRDFSPQVVGAQRRQLWEQTLKQQEAAWEALRRTEMAQGAALAIGTPARRRPRQRS
jgi:hypothetical protein